MKIQFITINKYKNVLLIMYIILLFIATIGMLELNYPNKQFEKQTIEKEIKKIEEPKIEKIENPIKPRNVSKVKEYASMPQNIDGYKVVGKLEIPKIELSTYILEETTTESMSKSVTKLTGPEINMEGNFCITGHNYNNGRMFGKLKKLEIGDKIILTDTYDRSVVYAVNSINTVSPKEIEVLSQNTLGEREVTLITCTTGALKRIVVKAIEEYD